jgi:hypothetical protein
MMMMLSSTFLKRNTGSTHRALAATFLSKNIYRNFYKSQCKDRYLPYLKRRFRSSLSPNDEISKLSDIDLAKAQTNSESDSHEETKCKQLGEEVRSGWHTAIPFVIKIQRGARVLWNRWVHRK